MATKDKKKKKKKAAPVPAPTKNFQMPAPAGAPPVAGNNQLDAALQMPMPNIAELLKSQQGFEKDKAFGMLNSGALGPVKRDSYGDVRTGPANPWENGTFGTPEEVAQRAQTGRDQRAAEMARPAGQYNMPRPQPTSPGADFVPRGGVNGVANLERNWNEGISEMPMAGPKTADQFMEHLNQQYPGTVGIGNMNANPQAPATVPSANAETYVRESLDPVYATSQQQQQVQNDPMVQASELRRLQSAFRTAPGGGQSDGTGIQLDSAGVPAAASSYLPEAPQIPQRTGAIPPMLANIAKSVGSNFGAFADKVTQPAAEFMNWGFGTDLEGTQFGTPSFAEQAGNALPKPQMPQMQAPPPGYGQTPGLPAMPKLGTPPPSYYQMPGLPQITPGMPPPNYNQIPGLPQFQLPTPPAFNPLMSGM